MGSCENSLEVQESLHWAATEQHSCLVKTSDSQQLPCLDGGSDVDVGPTCAPDQCLEFCQNGNSGYVSSGDFQEPLTTERGIGSACESRNVVGLVPGKLSDDEVRVIGGYLQERQSGIVDCNAETDGLCVKKLEPSDENDGLVNSLKDCVQSLDIGIRMPMSGSLRIHNQQDEQNGDRSGGVQGDMEEKSDAFAAIDSNTCGQMMPLLDAEMPAELRLMNVLSSNEVDQDNQDGSASLGRVMVVLEDRKVGLPGVETDDHIPMLPVLDPKTPSELIPMLDSSSNCFQQGHQKDDQIINSSSEKEIAEVTQKESKFLQVTEAATCGQLLCELGFVKSLELMPVFGSPQKSVKQDEQKDDRPVNLSCEQRVETVAKSKILSSLNAESCVQSDSFSDFRKDCCQKIDLEAKTVSSGAFESAVNGKIDALAAMKSDLCTQKPLHSIEMLKKLSITGFTVSGFERQDCGKIGNDVNYLAAVRVSTDILKKSDVDNYLEACSSQACQKTFESLPMDGLLGNSSQENEQRDDESIDDPFEESAPDVVEEKSEITTEVKVEVHDQKFYMEADAYDLKESSPEIAPSSPRSCQSFNVTENGAFRGLNASHAFGKAVFGAMSISTEAESYEEKANEVENLPRDDCPHKNGCPNIGSSSSRRSSRICKSCHKRQAKAARKHKNKARVQDLQIFKAERRKRTCFSKPARSSNWGSLGNIAQFFEQRNGLWLREIVPSKTKVGRERGKQNKSRVSGSSQRSSAKKHAPTGGIRLKVKLGNKVCQDNLNIMASELFDTPACGDISDFETQSYMGTGFQNSSFANAIDDRTGEGETEEQLQCLENKLEEAKIHSDASISDLHVAYKYLEGSVISQKSSGDAAGGCLELPYHVEVEESRAETEKRYTDPGTSPDSEVINLVPENQTYTGCREDFPEAILTHTEVFVGPGVVSSSKKGKKDMVSHVSRCFPEDICPQMACVNKVKTKKKQRRKETKGDGLFSSETRTSSTSANASSNSSSNKESSEESLHLSSKNELLVSREAFQAEIKAENKAYSGLDAGLKLLEPQYSNHLLPSTKSMGSRLPKKSDRASKGRSIVCDKARNKRENGCRRRGNKQKSNNVNKVREKSDCGDVNCKAEDDPETGNCILDDDTGKTNHGDNIASMDAPNMASSKIVEHHIPVDNAWVRCDDCHKWRHIPVALVDSIGQTNCQWICKDNMNKAFADCSIPQEKSNAEINAELGLSDADEDVYDVPSKSKGLECKNTVSKEHEFMHISANQLLHRSHKTQTIDEIMVCNCKLPLDGSLGCKDKCLNRMLNIECVQGTCPCGDHCSNQQFQKRIYAKMKWDRCGKKGFGLRLEEDLSKGQFVIEYVGEVLDMHTYEARQREYAFNGHKHFYFMTLNGSEVIDACAKGNLGRFINHSCNPSCRTEKWVVNGEICIGLFALRDIKKGEELTFDYNYIRVVGAAAKKCYCGSSHCRGYIGGDPTSTEVIDQVDSDEEFLEPVMLEDGEAGLSFKNGMSRTSSFNDVEQQIAESISKDKNKMAHSRTADVKLEVASEIEDSTNQSVSTISPTHSSLELDDLKGSLPSACQPLEISKNTDNISSQSVAKHRISMEDIQRSETSPPTKLGKLSDGSVTKLKSKSSAVEEKRVFVKSRFLIKTSRESSCSKKGKLTNDSLSVNRVPMLAKNSQLLSIKPKKLINSTSNARFESVEEKLNELLDVDGGISKRNEAAKCYLKFLLLTAASGASGNGEAIQSNRDLSIILDALLKTKSRAVLIDIINKNGLRMLHNMMKQYRRDFKKTPILRKLLKVLEYLAFRVILTQEHITGGPPCPGMESFTDSILSLTEHDDKQVHQIARNFRDKWIPRHCRRFSNMDRNDGRMDCHKGSISNRVLASYNHLRDLPVRPIEAINCATQPKPATAPVDTAVNDGPSAPCVSGGTKSRKRKSRWDQPAKEKPSSSSQNDEQKIQSALLQHSEYNPPPIRGKVSDYVDKGTRQSYCPHCAHIYCRQDENSFADNGRQNNQSDVPPGFSSSLNPTLISSGQQSGLMFPDGIVVGYPQKKFISRLSVSYGIPKPIVQQFGSPQNGTIESWAVAPGMPFHPFPPLPPFPHHNKESRFSPPVTSAVNSMVIDETAEEGHQLRNDPAACDQNENSPSTTGSNQPDIDIPGENGQQSFKRARASQDQGRRYFRQQKWNKVPPPWVWNRDGWGYLGNNSRGGICNNDVGSCNI